MPQVVRLPAHVKEGEVRAYWDSTWEDTGIFIAGGGARSIVRDALCGQPIVPGGGDTGALFDAFASRAVKRGPSMIDRLEAEGYDPKTLVFSIMRKDSPPPAEKPPSDIRSRLEAMQSLVVRLGRSLEDESDHKGVYVFDHSEMSELQEIATDCESVISELLDDMPL